MSLPASSGYVAPTVPVTAKCLGFWWGADLVDAVTWTPRYGALGALTGTNTTLEATGWARPGSLTAIPTWRFLNTASAYASSTNGTLVGLQDGDDESVEILVLVQYVTATNPSTILGWTSTSSTTPRKILNTTTGPYRWSGQATVASPAFTSNGTNALQQVIRLKVSGTNVNLAKNGNLDGNTGVVNVVAQAVSIFTVGCQWNGGSGPTNFMNGRVAGIWIRDPATAALTDAEELEILNWAMGAYDVAPYYSGATPFHCMVIAGQSNAQGIATGSPSGLPAAGTRVWQRSLNNWLNDPTALEDLQVRSGQHGCWAYQPQNFPATLPGHQILIGRGATSIGSDWNAGESAQGLYSTSLPSELQRALRMGIARLGGAPVFHVLWNQWENDAAAGPVVAADYVNQLPLLLAKIRAVLGAGVHIHGVMPNPNITGGGIVLADLNTIRAAYTTIAGSDALFHLIETNTLTDPTYIGTDHLHYNAAGYQALWNLWITSIQANEGLA